MKYVGLILRIVLFSIIPALLAYISREDGLLSYLGDHGIFADKLNNPLLRQLALLFNVLLTSGFLVTMYEIQNRRSKKLKWINEMLYDDMKTSFLLAVSNELEDPHVNSIRFRVFQEIGPVKRITEWFKCKLANRPYEKIFELKHIPGLSDPDNADDLFFTVTGDSPQGLVGKCYNERSILYEEDISPLAALYNLTPFQISKTRDTRFCMCVPIFNANSEIVTIISMDCIYSIKIPQHEEALIADMITVFVQDLSKYFPKLFK
jgi:hypothetical protein